MTNREKVMKGLECCSTPGKPCRKNCPYGEECFETDGEGITHLCSDALELLKSLEAALPMDSVLPDTTYQRLMAIKEELEAKNHTLTTEVRELRRLTESLSNLCHNLLKRLAAYET